MSLESYNQDKVIMESMDLNARLEKNPEIERPKPFFK